MASTTAELSGNIMIGTLNIPVRTALPPTTIGQLVFSYDLPAGETPTNVLKVGDFITWATSKLHIPDPGLPSSLSDFSVGVSHLLIDTSGTFEIAVLMGSMDPTWNPTWTPVQGLPFSLSNLRLEVDYGPAELAVSAEAATGATELTFTDASRVAVGMKVTGSGIATGTTVASATGTTVTLSAATTAAIPVGQLVTFTTP